jgi:hypothetical protein
MIELTFNGLSTIIKDKDVYMMLGNGNKNQFKDIQKVKHIVKNIIKTCSHNSVFLYFGDPPNEKKPDIGLLFKLLHFYNPVIKIYMIQISKAKSWGVPDFVSGVYWHNDYTKQCEWGGIIDGKPCSNTKKWVSLNKRIKGGIKKVFIFGGGQITLDEYKLIQKLNIPYEYFPVERKFKGDGITKINPNTTRINKIGVTWNKIKNY